MILCQPGFSVKVPLYFVALQRHNFQRNSLRLANATGYIYIQRKTRLTFRIFSILDGTWPLIFKFLLAENLLNTLGFLDVNILLQKNPNNKEILDSAFA